MTVYDASRPFVALAAKMVCSYKVHGGGAEFPAGPVIVASNHLSWLDVPLIGLAIPRRMAFMAKSDCIRSRVQASLVRLFGGFVVDAGTIHRSALREAFSALEKGIALGIFPEGTTDNTHQLKRGRLGTAYIALSSNATIIPVGICGTENMWNCREDTLAGYYRARITVNIGQPFRLPPPANRRHLRVSTVLGTETIMRHIAALLPEAYRGVYRDVDGKADNLQGVRQSRAAIP